MEYTLMHKNISVAELEIHDEIGHIVKIYAVHTPEHLPVGLKYAADSRDISVKNMDDWWTGRSIPASRSGLRDALDILGVSSPVLLLDKCMGLSLSDQYWVRPKDSDLTWESVNFFTNDFSKDVGEILFGRKPKNPAAVSLVSPDNTSDGWLRKKWIIVGGKRYLMKGGSGVYKQEPFNEVIASEIMRRLGVPHAGYSITRDDEMPYSLSENFVTPETELIPAYRIIATVKKSNNDSDIVHFLRCCDTLGITGVKPALDKMLTVDYIIANEDRHYNNFGFIRNAETLEWSGFAPIYDSGTSLWYNTTRVGSRVDSKPFKKSHEEQIQLVSDFKWFDSGALKEIDEVIIAILSESNDIDENRRSVIAKTVLERVRQIERCSY